METKLRDRTKLSAAEEAAEESVGGEESPAVVRGRRCGRRGYIARATRIGGGAYRGCKT